MSLINKMLQDLDARGSKPDRSLQMDTKPVAVARSPEWLRPALVGGVVLAAAGVVGFVAWKRVSPAPAAEPARRAKIVVPAEPRPLAPRADELVPKASSPKSPVVASAPAKPEAAAAALNSSAQAARTSAASAASASANVHAAPATHAAKAPETAPAASPPAEPPRATAPAAQQETLEPASTPAPKAKRSATSKQAKASSKAGAAAAASDEAAASSGLVKTPAQRAESDYRKALTALQEGHVVEAIGDLEQALQLDPRHDAARQTLVGLLVEARRNDEAIQVLQAGLALEPRQPNMAMLLSRLMIERGASGVEPLLRTLPYATGNANYHAFLAGVLQRESRHREAIEHFQAALQATPQNGVWQMGLGISLLAEKRPAEALEAFKRAKASTNLSPELQAFVARKLNQLSR